MQSMGSIMPLDNCPPNAAANIGTDIIPAPCTPVFAIPVKSATAPSAIKWKYERWKEKRVIKMKGS